MIHGLIISREASAVIGAYLIVAFSETTISGKVALATAANQPLAGTTGKVGATAAGQIVDIETGGVPSVRLGGTVAAGDWLTSDGQGRAIKTTAAGQRTIGRAERPGVVDDIINYTAAPGVVGGA